MNNLSYFLYFAGILPNLSSTVLTVSLLLPVVWVGVGLFSHKEYTVTRGYGQEDIIEWEPFDGWSSTGVTHTWVLKLAVFFLLVSVLIPPTETIYLIAGSEAGEMVITSEAGAEMLDNLQKAINSKLSEFTAEE